MIKSLIGLYLPSYLTTLVYMLQSVEYHAGPYLKWVWRTKDFRSVMQRRTLDQTRPARLLLLALRIGVAVHILLSGLLIYLGFADRLVGGAAFGAALFLIFPFVWAHLLVVPLVLGRMFISGPADAKLIESSKSIFADHPGFKIAVAGSYGKTTMKELLNTVLSQGLKVAATPANKNVSSSHARFAAKLKGDEDVLIIEYGEGAPGDVYKFARLTHPTHAIITGLAPAHLDRYKTLADAGGDIFEVATYLSDKNVYVNNDSEQLRVFIKDGHELFDTKGALGWKTNDIQVDLNGTSFTLTRDKKSINLNSGLIGRHQVGFLAFVATLGMQLGLSEKQVKEGIAATKPFEHRMQPYQLNGAWIVDDTYNGNLEGIRAGTQLLKDLKAKRKIYVTPGLVDQGVETERVHIQVGKLIADVNPDLVVLMQNSVADHITRGLKEGEYQGEIQIEPKPLEFYTNLSHIVANGDLVVMQNDWTDNYF